MMSWREKLHWPFADIDDLHKVWDEARRQFFVEDERLDDAFRIAVEKIGIRPEE